jgi:hypothetical protein
MLRIPTVPVVPLFPHQRIEDLVQRIEQLVMGKRRPQATSLRAA